MSRQVRINVRSAINNAGIRRERRDGRDYMIVPSATMPDGVIMNRTRYSADEIGKAFGSLENTPAPLGHPTVEGAFVSAKDPEGLARGWIGAWNRNVRRENGRVFIDKVIDVATASQLDGGKTVLEAIEKGEPIHSSTGLYAILTAVENDADVDWEASDIVFDHDAILIGEDGAATPKQGVGLMVNAGANPEGQKIDVINSSLEECADQEIDWAVDSLLRAVERKERIPLLERIKRTIADMIKGDPTLDDTQVPALSAEHDEMDKAQFDALMAEVAAIKSAPSITEAKVQEIVGNALKPMLDAQDAERVANAAKAETERLDLVTKVVANGLLDEAIARDATTPVLNALLSKGPAPAFRVNGAFKPSNGADRAPLALKGE